jgi:hypothetical protein
LELEKQKAIQAQKAKLYEEQRQSQSDLLGIKLSLICILMMKQQIMPQMIQKAFTTKKKELGKSNLEEWQKVFRSISLITTN